MHVHRSTQNVRTHAIIDLHVTRLQGIYKRSLVPCIYRPYGRQRYVDRAKEVAE